MPPKSVTLRRTDGSTVNVTPEQAEKLKVLGYKEEAPEERGARLEESAKEEYYSGTGQQVLTGVEGLLRGGSLGLTDYLSSDEEIGERARYNPGIATATEIAGAIAPSFVPGLSVVAPSSIVGRGARALAPGKGFGQAAIRGAAEGGAFGGAMAADHAYLKGDPITSEAVLHGMGWGALFGAGLASAGEGITALGKARVERGAKMVEDASAIKNLSSPGAYEAVASPAYSNLNSEVRAAVGELRKANRTTEAILTNDIAYMRKLGIEKKLDESIVGKASKEIEKALKGFFKTVKNKDFTADEIEAAVKQFDDTAVSSAQKAGLPVIGPEAVMGNAKGQLTAYAQSIAIQRTLNKIPQSAAGFAKLGEEKAQRLFAALSEAKKLDKFPAITSAIDAQANKLQEALGLTPTGVDGLRAAWQIARKQVGGEATAVKPAEASTSRKVAGVAAGVAGFKAASTVLPGHPFIALGIGGRIRRWVQGMGQPKTPELVAARNATIGRIKQAVGNFQIKTGKAVGTVGPKMAALMLKLDGTVDTSTKDAQQLALNRIDEFAQASVHYKDTLFRAIEPIAVEQPELGPGVHNAAVSAFQAAFGMMPSNPGVVSRLISIWKPSAVQAAILARQLEVFQDPVGAAEDMLFKGEFDPIKVKALKKIAPATYEQLRVEMIGRIQNGLLDKATYRDQVMIGALLDIPIHSSMKPEYIAASQAIHFTRSAPLPTPTQGSQEGEGAGRPSDSPGVTQGQIITSR